MELFREPSVYIPISSLSFTLLILALSALLFSLPKSSNPSPLSQLSSSLLPYIRPITFTILMLIALVIFLFSKSLSPNTPQLIHNLVHLYGLGALFLLFLVLTPGLLAVLFPDFSLNPLLIKARRALGFSTFLYALIHATLAFIYIYDANLIKITQLQPRLQIALYFGATALSILTLMAATSFDKIVKFLIFTRWKALHRLVYVAIILVVFHGFLRGEDFQIRINLIPLLVAFLSYSFILLESSATTIELAKTISDRSKLKNFIYFCLLSLLVLTSTTFTISQLSHPLKPPLTTNYSK